jgi:hypothetical protein
VSAHFSEDRLYRYSLHRLLGAERRDRREKVCVFVGLNPSTADETNDDPTVRRCIRFATDWGYGRLVMLNLYAYRSTDPRGLWKVEDPVGPENDHVLAQVCQSAARVVVAWGANAKRERVDRVMLPFIIPRRALCLGVTASGMPLHPLYLRADTVPVPFEWERSAA